MPHVPREIARLKGAEQLFDLDEHFEHRVAVALGSAGISLAKSNQANKNSPPSVLFTTLVTEEMKQVSGRSVWLQPGYSARIGRRHGLEIFDSQDQLDKTLMKHIGAVGLAKYLKRDKQLEREHAEIRIVSPSVVAIEDFGSRHGTIVSDRSMQPEITRGNLRLIRGSG